MINTVKGNCEFTFIQDTRPGATFYVSVEIDSCSADDASFCLRSFHFVWQMNTVNYQLSGSLNDLQLNHETIQYYSKVSTNKTEHMSTQSGPVDIFLIHMIARFKISDWNAKVTTLTKNISHHFY